MPTPKIRPLRKRKAKTCNKGAILTLLPAALWNGRNVKCSIPYVETRRATYLQAATAAGICAAWKNLRSQ